MVVLAMVMVVVVIVMMVVMVMMVMMVMMVVMMMVMIAYHLLLCSFQRSAPHGSQQGSGHEGERPRGVLHQLNQEPRHQQVEEDEMCLI